MRLGKISYEVFYIVDLDNKDMVDHAKEAIYEDVCAAARAADFDSHIDINHSPESSENDIEEFLLDKNECDDSDGVETCPECNNTCKDDVTIEDHGLCLDCLHEHLPELKEEDDDAS
jgi:hypothetical protein